MACGPGLDEVVEDQHYQPRLQLQLQPPSEPLCSSLGSPIPACRVKYFCGGSVKYITRLRYAWKWPKSLLWVVGGWWVVVSKPILVASLKPITIPLDCKQ